MIRAASIRVISRNEKKFRQRCGSGFIESEGGRAFRKILNGLENAAGLALAVQHKGKVVAGDPNPLGTGDNRPAPASQLVSGLLNLRRSFGDCVSVHGVLLSVARCSEEWRRIRNLQEKRFAEIRCRASCLFKTATKSPHDWPQRFQYSDSSNSEGP